MHNHIAILTLIHVVISLTAISTGFAVVGILYASRPPRSLLLAFLITTALTSITGFLFPFNGMTPALGVGIIATTLFIPTCYAMYARHLTGRWRTIFILGVAASLYFNSFVLVVQLFLRVPALRDLAPTQREAPHLIVQLALLIAFVIIAITLNARFQHHAAAKSG